MDQSERISKTNQSDKTKDLFLKKEGTDSLEVTNRLSQRFSTPQKNLVQIHENSSSSDILERVTQDYVNAHHLTKSYVEKHVHLQEMYFTLSKVMLLYQQKRGDDSRILEHLMLLVKNAKILSGEDLDKLISEQKQIMDETKMINDKIDDEFFSEKNLLFRDLTDEQKQFIKHSSLERQNIAKQKMQDLQLFQAAPTRSEPHFQHLFEPVLESFYKTFYNDDQTSFLIRELTLRSKRKTTYDLLDAMIMPSEKSNFQCVLPCIPMKKELVYAEMTFKVVPLRLGSTHVYFEQILTLLVSNPEQRETIMKPLTFIKDVPQPSAPPQQQQNIFQPFEFDLKLSEEDPVILCKDKTSPVDLMSLIYCYKESSQGDGGNLVCYLHENLKDKDFFYILRKDLLIFLQGDGKKLFSQEISENLFLDENSSNLAFLLPRPEFDRVIETTKQEKSFHYLLRETFPIEMPSFVAISTEESFQSTRKNFLFLSASLFFYVTHSISVQRNESLTIPRKTWFQKKLNLLNIKPIADPEDVITIRDPGVWLEICFENSSGKDDDLETFIEQFISTSDKVWFAKSMTLALGKNDIENMIHKSSFSAGMTGSTTTLSDFYFVLIPFFYQCTNYFYQYLHVSLSLPSHLLPLDSLEDTIQKLVDRGKGSSWEIWLSVFSSGPITLWEQEEYPSDVASKLKQFLRISDGGQTEKSVIEEWSNSFRSTGRGEVSLLLDNVLFSNQSVDLIVNQDILYGKYPSLKNFVRFYFYISLCVFCSIRRPPRWNTVEEYFELASQCLLKIKHSDVFASYFQLLFSQTERSKDSWLESIKRAQQAVTLQLKTSFKNVIMIDGKREDSVNDFYVRQISKLMKEHPEFLTEEASAESFYEVMVRNLVGDKRELPALDIEAEEKSNSQKSSSAS
jgi:hypothetical protein